MSYDAPVIFQNDTKVYLLLSYALGQLDCDFPMVYQDWF